MASKTNLDFSLKNVPDTWTGASEEAGLADDRTPLSNQYSVKKRQNRHRADLLAGSLAGIAVGIITGAAWYVMATREGVNPPWAAVAMGLIIAAAVRLAAGKPNPELRATLSGIFYLFTLLPTAFLITRYQYRSIQNTKVSLDGYESVFTNQWLTDTQDIVAWGLGLVLAVGISYMAKEVRR